MCTVSSKKGTRDSFIKMNFNNSGLSDYLKTIGLRSQLVFNEEGQVDVLVPGSPEVQAPVILPYLSIVEEDLRLVGESQKEPQNSPSINDSHGNDTCVPVLCGAKLGQVSDCGSVPLETWTANLTL